MGYRGLAWCCARLPVGILQIVAKPVSKIYHHFDKGHVVNVRKNLAIISEHTKRDCSHLEKNETYQRIILRSTWGSLATSNIFVRSYFEGELLRVKTPIINSFSSKEALHKSRGYPIVANLLCTASFRFSAASSSISKLDFVLSTMSCNS